MADQTNVRINKVILEKIDQLHSKSLSRGYVVNKLLTSAVLRWEKWLTETGEIECCQDSRVGEYLPIEKPFQDHRPYTKQEVAKQREELAEFGV